MLNTKNFVFRLSPGQDLKKEIKSFVDKNHLQAAAVLTAVGSLKTAQLRLAGAKSAIQWNGPFEIVSLSGTLCSQGLHLHITLADSQGQCLGGHLMDGCLIHTTAEIVLVEHLDLKFNRIADALTGYNELNIENRI